MVVGAATSLFMAAASAGFTRYVYSVTRRTSTLKFGIISTTGFTLSAAVYALGGEKNELTAAMLGSGTGALLAGMTTVSAVRSRHPIPGLMALLSVASIIVHFKVLESIGLREKERRERELLSHPVSIPNSSSSSPSFSSSISSALDSSIAASSSSPSSSTTSTSPSSSSPQKDSKPPSENK